MKGDISRGDDALTRFAARFAAGILGHGMMLQQKAADRLRDMQREKARPNTRKPDTLTDKWPDPREVVTVLS